PGFGHLPAVPGGEEVEGVALYDVEAERATEVSAVDGITAGQQRSEHARRALDLHCTGARARTSLDRGNLGGRNGAVRGDNDTVGYRVHIPGDAVHTRPVHRGTYGGELACTVVLGGCR